MLCNLHAAIWHMHTSTRLMCGCGTNTVLTCQKNVCSQPTRPIFIQIGTTWHSRQCMLHVVNRTAVVLTFFLKKRSNWLGFPLSLWFLKLDSIFLLFLPLSPTASSSFLPLQQQCATLRQQRSSYFLPPALHHSSLIPCICSAPFLQRCAFLLSSLFSSAACIYRHFACFTLAEFCSALLSNGSLLCTSL